MLSSCGWMATPVTVGDVADEDEAEDDGLLALELEEEPVGVGPEAGERSQCWLILFVMHCCTSSALVRS